MMRWLLLALGLLAWASLAWAQTIAVGSRVQVVAPINVRATAGGTLVGTQPVDAQGTVTSGPTVAPIGGTGTTFTWWQINYDTGADGWSGQDNLIVAPAAPGVPSAPMITRRDVAVWMVSWTWTGGAPALTSAEIQRGAVAAGPFTPLITTAAGVALYEDRSVVKGQPYCYRLRGRLDTATTAFTTPVCTP